MCFRFLPERPLGVVTERYLHAAKGMVTGIGITSNLPLTEAVVNQTLKHLMNMHTLLRMCIRKNEEDILYFRNMETNTKDKVQAEIRNGTNWNTVVDENTTSAIFDSENGPLWKCIFLPNATMNNDSEKNLSKYNCVVIFVQDHAINDGVGTMEMIKSFMIIVNQLLNKKAVDTKLSLPVLPQEYFLNKRYPISAFQKGLILLGQVITSFELIAACLIWIRIKVTTNIFVQRVGLEEEKSQQFVKSSKSYLQILSKKETRNLVQACKNNRCTVQSAIQAASNVALAHILEKHGSQYSVNLMNFVPIDLRRILDNPMAIQASAFGKRVLFELNIAKHILQLDTKQLWKLARDIRKVVHTRIDKQQHLNLQICLVFIIRKIFQANDEEWQKDS